MNMNASSVKQALENATPEERAAMIKELQKMVLSDSFDRQSWLDGQEAHMKKRFEILYGLQDKVDTLMKEYAAEKKALEVKYRGLCEPHFEERSKIVAGAVVPEGGEGPEVGVPGFWLKAFANNDGFSEVINEKDAKVLEHLVNVTCTPYVRDDGEAAEEGDEPEFGFKLTFTFSTNPFFSHTELTKTYIFSNEEETVLTKSVGTEIDWVQGKDPTVKVLKKKGKAGGPTKYKTEKVESFFNFFSPPTIPDEDDPDEEVDDEELEEALEEDYELGVMIKEKILPQAMKWFTGEAAIEQGMIMLDEDEDDDDDDDEEEDDDDDEDDAPAAPPQDKNQQECKQQ